MNLDFLYGLKNLALFLLQVYTNESNPLQKHENILFRYRKRQCRCVASRFFGKPNDVAGFGSRMEQKKPHHHHRFVGSRRNGMFGLCAFYGRQRRNSSGCFVQITNPKSDFCRAFYGRLCSFGFRRNIS